MKDILLYSSGGSKELLNFSVCFLWSLVSQIVGKFHLWFLYVIMTFRGLLLQTTKLINKIVDNLEKCNLLSYFQYFFRYSYSTADLLTVEYYRITWVFNRSGAIQAAALDIFKAFSRICHAGLPHKLKS